MLRLVKVCCQRRFHICLVRYPVWSKFAQIQIAWKFASVTSACNIVVIWFHFEETAFKIPRLDSFCRPWKTSGNLSAGKRKLSKAGDRTRPSCCGLVCADQSTLLGVDPHVRESWRKPGLTGIDVIFPNQRAAGPITSPLLPITPRDWPAPLSSLTRTLYLVHLFAANFFLSRASDFPHYSRLVGGVLRTLGNHIS